MFRGDSNTTITDEAFAARLITEASPVLLVPCASDGIALTNATNPIAPTLPKSLTLSATLDILNDLACGHSAEVAALRSDLAITKIGELARVAIEVLQSIGEVDWRKALPPANRAPMELHAYLQSDIHGRIQLQRAGQAKIGHLYDLIASGQKPEIVVRGIDAWRRAYQGGYLSLDPAGVALPLVAMLDAAEFPRHLIVLRGTAGREQALMAAFRTGTPGLPRWQTIQPRPGRPHAYLALASKLPLQAESLGNAALGMGGVHAVMFAAAVRHQMTAQPSSSKSQESSN